MSLVNDMLRDLNRRKTVPGQALRVNGAINTSFEPRKSDSRMGIVLLLGVVAGLGGGYAYFNAQPAAPVAPPLAVQPTAQAIVPAPVVPEAPAVVEAVPVRLDIAEEALSSAGFTLRIKASERIDFTITERQANGLTLHLDGIDSYDGKAFDLSGLSVLMAGDGANIELDLGAPADFAVYEDANTEGFDILLSATYRPLEVSVAEAPALPLPQIPAPMQAEASLLDQYAAQPGPVLDAQPLAAPQSVMSSQPVVPAAERTIPVRTTRGLTLEEQDRSTSQTAVSMVQGGRLFEAYERLLVFLTNNPSAHQSRETLATILLAQQEFVQATTVIDEGLAIAPNYAPYKKIKARLLMRGNDSAGALELLRSVPPQLASDTEYHELLASLYQQTNNHPQAVTAYQDLLRFNGQEGRWWAGLGVSLEAQGNKADALSSYRAALQATNLDPGLRQYSQGRIRSLGEQQ